MQCPPLTNDHDSPSIIVDDNDDALTTTSFGDTSPHQSSNVDNAGHHLDNNKWPQWQQQPLAPALPNHDNDDNEAQWWCTPTSTHQWHSLHAPPPPPPASTSMSPKDDETFSQPQHRLETATTPPVSPSPSDDVLCIPPSHLGYLHYWHNHHPQWWQCHHLCHHPHPHQRWRWDCCTSSINNVPPMYI